MFNTLGQNRNANTSNNSNNNNKVNNGSKENERYAFIGDYYDPQADFIRQYQILFYPIDNSIEMYDMKSKKVFLKRTEYLSLSAKDFYLGAIVNINSRQMKITQFADQYTQKVYESMLEITLAMIKPDGVRNAGGIIDAIYNAGFRITKLKMVHLTQSEAMQFYSVHQGKPFYNSLVEYMTSGKIIALELAATNAIQKWRELIGPTNTDEARQKAPQSIRARFGSDKTRNAVHGSDCTENAQIESNFFFSGSTDFQDVASYSNSTLAIVKPHAVLGGVAGEIIQRIQKEGFQLSAIEIFNVDKANAADFYEVYKNVVAEYQGLVDCLCSGPCIAMELKSSLSGPETVEALRALCGPADPEIARVLRPNTIRALYGDDKVNNAIHCTDLEEDGVLEVEFFFKILSAYQY